MSAANESAQLLVELGTEELPPVSLRTLRDAFASAFGERLTNAGLAFGNIQKFATPRRLALIVDALQLEQAARDEELRGPPTKVAFDDKGQPSRAALAFAEKCGVDISALKTVATEKGEWLVHRRNVAGQTTAELLPELLADVLASLPVDRRMRWGSGDAEFVRPVQWLTFLLGNEVVKAELFGQQAGRSTFGHRFHAPAAIDLASASEYTKRLEKEGRIIVDFERRKEMIRSAVIEAAAALGGTVEPDEALFDEVTAMVEWPVAVSGRFDPQFLELPREVLISTLKKHQRYFPVVNDKGGLLAHFITVANIASSDPSAVAAGNERVVTPRLADADFFWRSDRSQPLEARLARLKTVVYEKSLGSIFDKSERVAALSALIADTLGADANAARRAAMLARCDLVTDLVGEFPDLQGVMGGYYARADGEPESVSEAIGEFYRPAFAGDAIPVTSIGRIVAIADRLDTLAGVFAAGKRPKGNRDPFGLRRAALGVARIVIEGTIELDLAALIDRALQAQPQGGETANLASEIYDFVVERLRAYFSDTKLGMSVEVFEAVRQRAPGSLLDFDARLQAVIAFSKLEQAESLAAANKRIGNILRKTTNAGGGEIDKALLTEAAEGTLFSEFSALKAAVEPLLERRDYTAALSAMAALRDPIDQFFDDVMVMAEDATVRSNRLNLLSDIRELFLKVADISLLSPG